MARPISGRGRAGGLRRIFGGRGDAKPGGARPSARGAGPRPPRSSGVPGSAMFVGAIGVVGVALLVGAALFANGNPGTTPSPSPGPSGGALASAAPPASGSPAAASPAPGSSAQPGASPGSTPGAPTQLPLALVADVRDLREGISTATLAREIAAGRVAIPCGLDSIALGGDDVPFDTSTCLAPGKVMTAVRAHAPRLGLLPAALVNPRVKVLRVAGADLFGPPSVRTRDYPVVGTAPSVPSAWTGFDPAQVRTLISVGDTCPDRGVSRQAIVEKKGWGWVLGGGTARYTGTHMDTLFDGPDGKGWPVVDAVRTGNEGAVRALISDAEITLDDFECPMTAAFRQHDTGTVFSIDPRVAPLLAAAGVDVVTLASNHATDQGADGLRETIDLFGRSGIKPFGAGMTLAAALKPAVVDVRGVRFAFVGFNEIDGATPAAKSTPGVAWLTASNVRTAIAAARKVADVVVVVPQWGWPEYHADLTARQETLVQLFFDAGADQVVGHGTHWAGATTITKGDRGYRFVIASHGNFLFGQGWSRQTQEGVIVELTFVGRALAQARLHPYIMLDLAQANLTDPTTDGATVLQQVWDVSSVR